MISVVCPFYNEESIIEGAVRLMLDNLSRLDDDWELIIVNDGSKDTSPRIARELEMANEKLRVVSYSRNRGRGYAIRKGVEEANGDLVVTTEIDSSWGDDIVERILEKFRETPDADIVIASPHLPGGGYRNVPAFRTLLSTLGNYVIRAGLTYDVTMNTGMTRGYKREKFLQLPLDEDEKEMHLEIVNKALSFGYRIVEIPAILEWRDKKLTAPKAKTRKSSAKINKLIRTHVLFSLLAAPFRYLYVVAALVGVLSAGFFSLAVINLFTDVPSIYFLLVAMMLGMFAVLTFGIGILAQQGRTLVREMWRMRSELRSGDAAGRRPHVPAFYEDSIAD